MDAAFFDQAGYDVNYGDELSSHREFDRVSSFKRSSPKEDFGGVNSLGNWFGKDCVHQVCQFESWYTEEGREEDRSQPVLVYCNHHENPNDTEGNCCEKLCPLNIAPVKRIVQISFAGNLSYLYDFYTDLDLTVGDPVVCDTIRGFSVGKVMGFVETSTKATNWIVQQVDVEGHKARMLARELEEMLG